VRGHSTVQDTPSPRGGVEPKSRLARAVDLGDPMVAAVWALGITQITSWGTTLYALGTLAKPIASDTGWSLSTVVAGLTVGLLVSGAVSTFIGKQIDRLGGRLMMSLGSVLAALGLTMLAYANSHFAYFLAWAVLGPAMRLTLYEAAFPSLVQVTPSRGRRAISYLTLFGGFASSVFWPIGQWLNGLVGWRSTFLVYAAVNLLVCLPLHWWGLARRERAPPPATPPAAPAASAPSAAYLDGEARTIAMALFAIASAASAFVFGAMAVHLPAVLGAAGLTAAAAVTLASIKGFWQVAGRTWELIWGHKLHALDLGRVAIVCMPLSFVVLILGGASFWTAFAFTALFGVANGLVTIVRGALPLALFGPEGYGKILGILATPYLLVNALAPVILALVIDGWGYVAAEIVVLAAALTSSAAMEIMALWYRHHRSK